MQILKIVVGILIAAGVGWVVYFYYQNQRLPGLMDLQTTASQFPSLVTGKVPMSSSALPAVETNQQALTEAIAVGKARVDQVLGDAIEVASESDKPAAQKALDYGRYLYCQQVVKEYEASN